MKKPQTDAAGSVAQPHQQRAATPETDIALLDHSLHHYLISSSQSPHSSDSGAVLISEREVEEYVLYCMDADPCQPLGITRTDPFERGNRHGIETFVAPCFIQISTFA